MEQDKRTPKDNSLAHVFELIRLEEDSKIKVRAEKVANSLQRFRQLSLSLTDMELMEIIWTALSRSEMPDFKQDEELDPFLRCLSFSRTSLNQLDDDSLGRAWTNFRPRLPEVLRTDDRDDLIALWYYSQKMWTHAISVYEHLYAEIRGTERVNELDWHGWWVFQLWRACLKGGRRRRAQQLCNRIMEYLDDGLLSGDYRLEFLLSEIDLRHDTLSEQIAQERCEAEARLLSKYPALLSEVHKHSKSLFIEAELWAVPWLRELEPTAAPRRWALAIEKEFHCKVIEPNWRALEGILKDVVKKDQSLSPGQISYLIKNSGSNLGIKAVFAALRGGAVLSPRSGTIEKLNLVAEHRKHMGHAHKGGLYDKNMCEQFLVAICDSEWVFQFLEAIQPR